MILKDIGIYFNLAEFHYRNSKWAGEGVIYLPQQILPDKGDVLKRISRGDDTCMWWLPLLSKQISKPNCCHEQGKIVTLLISIYGQTRRVTEKSWNKQTKATIYSLYLSPSWLYWGSKVTNKALCTRHRCDRRTCNWAFSTSNSSVYKSPSRGDRKTWKCAFDPNKDMVAERPYLRHTTWQIYVFDVSRAAMIRDGK